MSGLEDFRANGVVFPDVLRPDINELVERIPEDGTLHLAILQPPYLGLILNGRKTIESRFNTKRAAPYGKVAVGDLILLKETGAPVTAYFFAASARSIDLAETPLSTVRAHYAHGICAQDPEAFWRARASSKYCTLVEVGERGSCEPFAVQKNDQRGWVTFTRNTDSLF